MAPINFTTQYYFPSRFIWGAVASVAMVSFIAAHYYTLAALAGLSCAAIMTTRYGVEIDFDSKIYQEYTWVFGIKNGDKVHFENIQYLFIKDIALHQTFRRGFINSATIHFKEYHGFIKFSESEKIHILINSNREKLVIEMERAAQYLKTRLINHTQ
jgi:hypothetical protein